MVTRLVNYSILYAGWPQEVTEEHLQKERMAATHILVIMVSSEQRRLKPYAIAVQYIPYKYLRDQHIRDLVQKLRDHVPAGISS